MGTYLSRMLWKSPSSTATKFASLSSWRTIIGAFLSRIFLRPPIGPATLHSDIAPPLLDGVGMYFRRVFSNIPRSSATVIATLLSSLLAGIGTYVSRIPWSLPISTVTVITSLPSAFFAGMGSHMSRIYCMWMSNPSATLATRGVSSTDGHEQPMSYDVLKTYLLKVLECPVCYEVNSGPIFQCVNGHNVCASCRPHINGDRCAVCNASLTSCRNRLAEDLSSKMVGVPCKNHLEGCEEMVFEERMRQHLSACPFSYRCLVMTSVPASERYADGDCVSCEWRGSYREMMEHVEAEHPRHAHRDVARAAVPDVDLKYLLCVCNYVCLLASHGRLFWCRLALYHETNALGFNPATPKVKVVACARSVSSAGCAQEGGDELTCEFKLRAESCAALTLSIVCEPRPLGNDLECEDEVVRLCACVLETFISPEKQLSCTISVSPPL